MKHPNGVYRLPAEKVSAADMHVAKPRHDSDPRQQATGYEGKGVTPGYSHSSRGYARLETTVYLEGSPSKAKTEVEYEVLAMISPLSCACLPDAHAE